MEKTSVMKIVHVLNSVARGGAENLVINLAHQMTLKGHEVVIISLTDKVEYTNLIDEYGIKVVSCGFIGTIFSINKLFTSFRKLQLEVNKIQPDIIHSHIFLADVLVRALKLPNLCLITTFHSPEPWWDKSDIKSRLKTWLEGITARNRVKRYIAVSEEAKIMAVKYLGVQSNYVKVVMNGVDTELFQPSQGVKKDQLIVIHVARYYPEKAHELLITAFVLVVKKIPEAELWLVGDGPLCHKMKALVEQLGIQNNIKFLGLRSDIATLMQLANIFTLPSEREGLPISLLEAMATGLPVVVTRVGEMSNVVEHETNGLLIECRDSSAISNGLLRLALDKSFSTILGENARVTIINNYSITSTANEYLAVYDQALNT